MAYQSETMKSCRVQFVDMEYDTNDKIMTINPVERKIYDPRRITQGARFSNEIVAFFHARKRLYASI